MSSFKSLLCTALLGLWALPALGQGTQGIKGTDTKPPAQCRANPTRACIFAHAIALAERITSYPIIRFVALHDIAIAQDRVGLAAPLRRWHGSRMRNGVRKPCVRSRALAKAGDAKRSTHGASNCCRRCPSNWIRGRSTMR